jgi:hypothetical protein
MEAPGTTSGQTDAGQPSAGAATQTGLSCSGQRYSVCCEDGLPVAVFAEGLSPWQTVYGCFRRWRRDGSRAKAMQALREAARQKAGKNPEPSVALLDSHSEKGSAVMMWARKPKGESSTSPSIPWDSF